MFVTSWTYLFIYFNAALLKPGPKLPVTSRSIYTLLLLLNRHATLISLWFFCGPPPPGLNKFSQAQLRSPWSLTLCCMSFTVSSVSCKSLTFMQYTPTHSDAGVCMCMPEVNSLICMCTHTHSHTFFSIFHTVKHCISCAVRDQLVPRTRTVLVFDIALKSTEMASCFHPAQPHVNTLSPLAWLLCQFMQPWHRFVYAHLCVPSYSCRGNDYKSFKRDNNSGINLNF